jgi:hypothetical protein
MGGATTSNGVLSTNAGVDLAWTAAMRVNQFYLSTYTYYGTNNYDQAPLINSNFVYYAVLENVVRMEQEAKNAGIASLNSYSALGKFFRAYYYHIMTQKFGDIPLTDALQGDTNPAPQYTSQKQIYVQILQWLDDANNDMRLLIGGQGDSSLDGDIYLNNDLTAWQKVINTFTLRVLISLSKKESDTDLTIKTKFATIVNNPTKYPVMGSLNDNVEVHYDAAYNPYPKIPGNYKQTNTRENVSATILNLTTSLKDPRTFIVGTPAPAQLKAGKAISDYTAYVGASPGDDIATLGNNSQAGQYSFENALRYASTNDGSAAEPAMIIGYPELCFNIAEGINRGWATGNAGTWYVNGIKASMSLFGISDNAVITIGDENTILAKDALGTVTVSVTNYLAQGSVAYAGGATGLNQILTQKYIAFWQNSNFEAFFNQRRTGMPAFLTGVGTGNGQKLPQRWQYPYSEATANPTNYQAALQSQFGGTDNINGVLWVNQ